MLSQESPQNNSSKLVVLPQPTPDLPWDAAPLNLLQPKQQVQLKHQAQTITYKLGEKIWSTDRLGDVFILIQGKVRLKEAGSQTLATLTPGECGDLLGLSGEFKAVATSREVQVVRWDVQLWQSVMNPQIDQFWAQQNRYQSSLQTTYSLPTKRLSN